MKQIPKLVLVVFLSLLLAIAPLLYASFSYADNHYSNYNQTIRVGQLDLSGFYDYDRNGPIGGYGYEYLEEISRYTGWRYEYVPVTYENALEMLRQGDIDILAPVPKTSSLENHFRFSSSEIGLDYSVLCVSMAGSTMAYNDFAGFDGMKVGLLSDNSLNNGWYDFAEKNSLSVENVFYSDYAFMLKDLHAGKIDAMLTTSLMKRNTERIISKFNPSPYYYITNKSDAKLMQQLDEAISNIKQSNPYFDYDLQKKYYDFGETIAPFFTAEEKEFIRNQKPLRTVYDPIWAPIEFYDKETGKFSGINSEIFQIISEISGLEFDFINTKNYSEALSKIANYEADILTGIDRDASWANKHNMMQTNSYLTASIVLVKNINVKDLDSAKAALAQDFLAATEYIKRSNPKADIVYYGSTEECFLAINRGEADITYANSYVAEKLLQDPKLNKLAVVETVNLADHLCIGVSDSLDPIMLSILNKSIASISDTQMNRIIFKHTLNEDPSITFEYLLYKNPRYLFIPLMALSVLLVTIILILAFLIRSKNRHNMEIEKIAYTDNITGTSNYNRFKIDAQNLLKNNRNKRYAMIYMDIYKFSYINSTFGYAAGDMILSEVAKQLEAHQTEFECTARISADNFICLLEYESDDATIARGREFQKACDKRLAIIDSRFRINFVSAVYIIAPGETDIPILVGKADIAHKSIRHAKRGSIIFYDDILHEKFTYEKELEGSMYDALKSNQFILYLQPKYNISAEKITGVEALVRWLHPDEGLIPPIKFIPLFESNGFILDLDFYVYEKACQLLRKWLDSGFEPIPLSVNVSKAHLTNQYFSSRIKALTTKYDLPTELIELELTESIFLENSTELITMIAELKEMGFLISIDDFGSGFSSLNVLKDLPVDILKLDKDFFRRNGMESKDKAVVSGIVQIAKELELDIVSEGIETKEQVDFLLTVGCPVIQGYYYAKPMPVSDFEVLIKQS